MLPPLYKIKYNNNDNNKCAKIIKLTKNFTK